MNKKFSTLVAALLVSGGSFAMVSQYMGSTLTESPLAVAAAANLRAADEASEAKAKISLGAVEDADTWTVFKHSWKYNGKDVYGLKSGNFYLTRTGLTKNQNAADAFVIDDNKELIDVWGDGVLIGDRKVSFWVGETQATSLAENATGKLGTASTTAVSFNSENHNAFKVATDYKAAELVGSATASEWTKFTVFGKETSTFKLKFGAYYLAKDDAKGFKLSTSADDAHAFGTWNGSIFIGPAKYPTITSEGLSVANGASLYLIKAGEKLTATDGNLPAGLENGDEIQIAIDASTGNGIKFNDEVMATLEVNTASELKLSAEAQDGGFTLGDGHGKLALDASGNVVLSTTSALTFYNDAHNCIMANGKYLTTDMKLAADESKAMKAYNNNGEATALTAGDFTIGQAIANQISIDKAAKVSLVATANLVDGEIYMIQGASTSLAMVESGDDYELIATSSYFKKGNVLRATDVTSINGVLWKTVKGIVAGKAVYSFVNVATGMPLAFAENTAKNGVVFDVEGDYNTFMLDGESLVFTYTSTGSAGTKTYYVNPGTGQVSTGFATVTFAEADAETPTSVNAVDLLNKTYGAGNGFGIMFKDRALGEEKVKDVTLEANPFSDATLITAVTGPTNATAGKMFLMVSDPAGYAKNQTVANFRKATFIAVDTVRYSAHITDTYSNKFFKYTTVAGSQMMTDNGNTYSGETVTAAMLKKGGSLYGITRRIENAQFTVSQAAGANVADPIEFIVEKAYVPAENNGKFHLMGHTDSYYTKMAIKEFNKKNYLGAFSGDSWPYIYIGMNNDVDYKTVNGIVNIISRNYDTYGQPYATDEDYDINPILAKYVALDKPEGQFLATGGWVNANGTIEGFTFTNRESGAVKTVNGLKKTDKANIYAASNGDTLEIKAAAAGDKFIGYANYDAKVLANTEYVLKVVSGAAGIQDIYIAEDHNKDHSLGLNADTLEAANFKLIKFEGAAVDEATYDKLYGDTVFVSTNEYSYVAVDKKTKEEYYDTAEDYVVAFTYAIYNAANNEFLTINTGKGVTKAEYLYCNPELKYNPQTGANADVAQRFIIKEKANGAIQLIPVEHMDNDRVNIFRTDAYTQGKPIYLVDDPNGNGNELAWSKLYAGISDNKIYDNTDGIYKVADNDLFTIQQIGAPLYRALENEVYDKVRIYKEGAQNVALFAQSADKALVSGANWLGMEHKADADLNKTMFSFVLDTAYVDRGEKNYKPEYLLAIDSEVIPSVKYCDEHGINPDPDCGHTTQTIAYMKGSYLVNLADSANAWDKNAHVNPYKYGEYNRLGFVKATHVKDQLIIERGAPTLADTLNLTKGNSAKFALKIVDQATKSFVLENSGAYLKWLNGVPVMVGALAEAEVLNIEATENAATANEAIEAAGVQVIGGQGVVTVQGAAGKVITVANILGQTIANQVAASDNVTIAAPAGVVVVAVDGEATKVVVK